MATFYVYVLHADEPIGDPNNPLGQARHYVGATDNLLRRLQEHATGRGAKITAAFRDAGVEWRVAAVFTMNHRCHYLAERRVKKHHHTARFCCFCSGELARCIPGALAVDPELLGIPLTSTALAASAKPEDLEVTDVPF